MPRSTRLPLHKKTTIAWAVRRRKKRRKTRRNHRERTGENFQSHQSNHRQRFTTPHAKSHRYTSAEISGPSSSYDPFHLLRQARVRQCRGQDQVQVHQLQGAKLLRDRLLSSLGHCRRERFQCILKHGFLPRRGVPPTDSSNPARKDLVTRIMSTNVI